MDTPGELAVRRPPAAADDEDQRLWAAVQRGDDRAFEVLVSRHCDKVASVAGRLLSNASDVEDVVQETFVRAYAIRHRYPARLCLRAWLLRITINLCKSRLRTSWWRRVRLTGDPQQLEEHRPAGGDPASEALLLGEIEAAVARLPERLRTPFLLRYCEELSGAEIAMILGCSESTVWTRIYTARRVLKDSLTEPEGPEERS